MKLQRSTGILLGVAIALVSTVAIIETNKNSQTDSGEALYDFAEADVDTLTIKRDDATLSFAKTDDTWQMTEPENAPADPSAIAFLLNIITTDPIQETIAVSPGQLADYGLDDPTATVDMTVAEESHTLSIGDEDFSGTSLYTTTVPNTADLEFVNVYLMPKGLSTGLELPVEGWILSEEKSTSETADDESPQQQEETPSNSDSAEDSTDNDE